MPPRVPRPGDVRCKGIYGSKYKKDPSKIGCQCEVMLDAGKEYCAAHDIPEGRRCRGKGRPHYALRGQVLCGLHGGKAPRNLAAAARRLDKEKLVKQVARFLEKHGFESVTNPLEELQQVAGETVAIKDYLRGFVQKIEEIRYQGGAGEQIRGELQAYQAALRDTVNVLSIMARLDIDGRLVRVEEAKALLLIKAVNGALADAGVSGELAQRIRDAIADRLEAIDQA
jgi:hypothetical protein